MKKGKIKLASWLNDNVKKNGAVIGLLVVILVGILINGRVFLSIDNITNVGRQAALRGILACGIALPIISGTNRFEYQHAVSTVWSGVPVFFKLFVWTCYFHAAFAGSYDWDTECCFDW